MGKPQITRPSAAPSKIGVTPTTSQKLIYVAQKLGLPGIAGMQGSSVNIFDTILLPATNNNPIILDFFSNTTNKSANFTNFSSGSLKAGEAMVVERLSFFLLTLITPVLADTTQILDIVTIAELNPTSGIVAAPGSLKMGTIQVDIANQTVVKAFNAFEQSPMFNPKTTGISMAAVTGAVTKVGPFGLNSIELESPPVLPPNQSFSVKFRVPPMGNVTGNMAIMCVAGRFGSIFASKTTL
jgi:hypothetical protein